MTQKVIDIEFLENMVVGATVLGTGGGGDPKIGYLMAKQAILENGPVPLVDIEELPEGTIVGSVSMMGAPSVSLEKIPNGKEFEAVVAALTKYLDRKLEAIFPIEAGGLNSMIPIVAAARMGLPLVDLDCMGRAFPELQMVTPTIYDITYPTVLGNQDLDTMVMDVAEPKLLEKYCRSLTMDFGGQAIMSEAFMDKKYAEIFGIRGIVTKSYQIGKIVKESDNPIETLAAEAAAIPLFDGKIMDVLRTYDGGFNKGRVLIESFNGEDKYEIYLQNENLVAFKNGEAVAMVPDLICILDYQTKKPITTETLKFGQRISVIAFKADEKWRTEKGLSLVGPRVFGYDFDYIPVEELEGEK
jgi:DUF917 family protein